MNNYEKQAAAAAARFLTLDAAALAEKNHLEADGSYLYPVMLGVQYRLSRQDGTLEKQAGDRWIGGGSFEEVMTLLDLLCDSSRERFVTGRWKTMESFGRDFHRSLLEAPDPAAERFSREKEKLIRAGRILGGSPVPGADIGFAVELFDGLRIGLQFWDGDEEFAPRLRFLWDENARMYLHYETMFYAVTLLLRRLEELMAEM